jgi:hypothetical protein
MFIKNLIAALVGIWSAEVWVDAAIVANAKTSFSLN